MTYQKLKNVQKYSDEFKSTLEDSPYFMLISSATNKRMQPYLEALLNYKGSGKLKIPGTFIAAVPAITNLPVNHVIEILDISKSTYYRAKDERILEMETADKISSLLKIFNRGLEAFEGINEDFQDWLNSKFPNLGNKKPVELLKTENGRAAVLDAIDRIEYNVYG